MRNAVPDLEKQKYGKNCLMSENKKMLFYSKFEVLVMDLKRPVFEPVRIYHNVCILFCV
jgi:hypothetical protein